MVPGSATQFKAGVGPPVPQKCAHCDRPHQIGGPIYSDPMHDTAFVTGLLKVGVPRPRAVSVM